MQDICKTSCHSLPLLFKSLDWRVLALKERSYFSFLCYQYPNGFSSNRIPEAFMLFLEAHHSLHSINSVLRGLIELKLQGSSHQPATQRRDAEILRARSIPHRTMGAAILERTEWNAGPGAKHRARLRRKWADHLGWCPLPASRRWCGPARNNMATVFRPLESLRPPRPSLHPGVIGSGSACCRCTLGGTGGRRPGRREGGREGSVRPQWPLSLEKARAPFPFSCMREQLGLLGAVNPSARCLESKVQLGSGLAKVQVAL